MSSWQKHFPWTHGVLSFLWPDRAARRKRWVAIAGVVLVLFTIHAVMTARVGGRVARLADDLIVKYGPLTSGSLTPPPVPDADNASRAVRAATEMLVSDHKLLADVGLDSSSSNVEELARANAVALVLLDEAARRPAANWNLHYWSGPETDIPPLLRILDLAKLNAAVGRVAIRTGRVDDALAAFARGTAIERSLAREAILVVQLVRGAVNRVDAALAREILASGRLDGPALDRLATSLPSPDAHAAIHRSLVGETKVVHDSFPRFFELGAPMGDRMTSAQPLVAPVSWLLRPLVLENDRACLEYMSGLISAQRLPRHERGAGPPEPRSRPWHFALKTIVRNLATVIDRGDIWEARESMTRLAVAIERYRAMQGRFPESLDALVPTFLDSVPKDPFGGGASFSYKQAADGWKLTAGDSWRALDLGPNRIDPVLEWSRPTGMGEVSAPRTGG